MLEWWRFRHHRGFWVPALFVGPEHEHFDGSWAGLTVPKQDGTLEILLDPRPSKHSHGLIDTLWHEVGHACIDEWHPKERHYAEQERLLRCLTPRISRVFQAWLPPLPTGIEALRRRHYRADAKERGPESR